MNSENLAPPLPVGKVLPVEARLAGNADGIDSCTLLEGRDEVAIRHGAEIYRLRLTRQGKLILTK